MQGPKASVVKYKQMRFVITSAPTETTLPTYVKELRRQNVSDLIRACEVTYEKGPLVSEGVQVHELEFSDGDPPPPAVIKAWLDLVQARFGAIADLSTSGGGGNPLTAKEKEAGEAKDGGGDTAVPAIALHCIAGLGRAPVLVAIALIEAGFEPLDAVTFIRKSRRGAVNKRQLQYLESYRRQLGTKSCCLIM